MSALPPKADIFSLEIDVCFVPEADASIEEHSTQNCLLMLGPQTMALDVMSARL
jgi:hypothetical protein